MRGISAMVMIEHAIGFRHVTFMIVVVRKSIVRMVITLYIYIKSVSVHK